MRSCAAGRPGRQHVRWPPSAPPQLQRWARPVAAIRPGTVILRISQGRLAAPRSLRRTPVLILTHDSRGTLGVCLNNLLGPISLCKVAPAATIM